MENDYVEDREGNGRTTFTRLSGKQMRSRWNRLRIVSSGGLPTARETIMLRKHCENFRLVELALDCVCRWDLIKFVSAIESLGSTTRDQLKAYRHSLIIDSY